MILILKNKDYTYKIIPQVNAIFTFLLLLKLNLCKEITKTNFSDDQRNNSVTNKNTLKLLINNTSSAFFYPSILVQ